ncbi:hypothetical protein QTO34_003487 [Cnephaeus nilssonii]|uniref:Uncharacterized protein n=1 Tax=Cnephaeus nilssonii TaxID=3371016 RepID=A0AA40HQQ4_CNENI|nr:hypothetical protein QTO34_003487 [Eptesicus nilssonii]
MPAQIPELEIMDEDKIIKEVLDKFVNCHEQTYEEFLSTFTHLSKEDKVTQRGLFGTRSSEDIFISVQFTHENEPQMITALGVKPSFFARSLQPTENWSSAISFSITKISVERPKPVEVFPELAHLRVYLVDSGLRDLPLLPGEVEDVSTHIPSGIPSAADILPAAQPLTPAVRPKAHGGKSGRAKGRVLTLQILGDEVQPFRLDEEFDYDTVMLTPKFTPAEVEAIKEQLSKHKRENTNADLEEPRD